MKKSKNKSFVICGDIHIGSRGASIVLAEHQIKFFEDVLFPYMKKHGINTILQLGDLFDTRKYTNHGILHMWKSRVFDYMQANSIEMITLIGNHDTFSRNSLEVNSTELFLSSYGNLTIISEPQELDIEGISFLLVPWICIENQSKVNELLESTSSIFCAGHFEFDGFNMQRGVPAHGGTDLTPYSEFDMIFSGHYHTKSEKGNVLYVGTPYEQNWADYDDQKGFHVFDTSTHKVNYIKNPHTLFNQLEYDDSNDASPVAPTDLKDSYVKVFVVNKTDPYKFEKFITGILSQCPADLKITDIDENFDDVSDVDVKMEDTSTMMNKFIDSCETDLSKDKLKQIMNKLYVGALECIE